MCQPARKTERVSEQIQQGMYQGNRWLQPNFFFSTDINIFGTFWPDFHPQFTSNHWNELSVQGSHVIYTWCSDFFGLKYLWVDLLCYFRYLVQKWSQYNLLERLWKRFEGWIAFDDSAPIRTSSEWFCSNFSKMRFWTFSRNYFWFQAFVGVNCDEKNVFWCSHAFWSFYFISNRNLRVEPWVTSPEPTNTEDPMHWI